MLVIRVSALVVVDSNLLCLPGETLLLWGGFRFFEETPNTIFGGDVLHSYFFKRQEENICETVFRYGNLSKTRGVYRYENVINFLRMYVVWEKESFNYVTSVTKEYELQLLCIICGPYAQYCMYHFRNLDSLKAVSGHNYRWHIFTQYVYRPITSFTEVGPKHDNFYNLLMSCHVFPLLCIGIYQRVWTAVNKYVE